ncbi:MAG: ferrochelatase [Gammaproteobacteria bacterium]|nr:MAG: ferrochelatase [Gammaproteobacteria bacterium]
MARRGFLLINLGTPEDPGAPAVRRYLEEFLSDPRVIDINPWLRRALLHGVILPFRSPQTAAAYKKIWTERGSPLLVHGQDLARKLAAVLGEDWHVELAMRYQNPSIDAALGRFHEQGVQQIVVFLLFPHYSSAAWGSAIEKLTVEARRRWPDPALTVVPPYYDHPVFIDAVAEVARPLLADFEPDRVVLSYHGLPERQIIKADASGDRHCLRSGGCCATLTAVNKDCYRAQCFATSRALAARLGLAQHVCETAFQSRMGRIPWIRPYTDERVRALAQSGVRRLAVLSPAFTADCLETLEEIAIRAREDFIAHGGSELRLVPSLNSADVWVRAISAIAKEAADKPTQHVQTAP